MLLQFTTVNVSYILFRIGPLLQSVESTRIIINYESPDETPRRESVNMRHAAEVLTNFDVFHPWWNTASHAWYYSSNKMIFVGEMKDAKMSSFYLISKHSLNSSFVMVREKKWNPYRHPRLHNNPLFQILVKKNNLEADNEIRDSSIEKDKFSLKYASIVIFFFFVKFWQCSL